MRTEDRGQRKFRRWPPRVRRYRSPPESGEPRNSDGHGGGSSSVGESDNHLHDDDSGGS